MLSYNNNYLLQNSFFQCFKNSPVVRNPIKAMITFAGSGWQLMKHVFSTNEKRLFVLVISLQVVTNIAYVLKENTEEGAQKHELWQQIFILVDLVCCGAVLFPIVWSIRHLQEATKVDGKVLVITTP